MTIEQIIKKAVKGGMPPKASTEIEQLNAVLFLDPQFWQSLGKAMGWDTQTCYHCKEWDCGRGKKCEYQWDEWQGRWHSFIDHLAAGKDIESFFEQFA